MPEYQRIKNVYLDTNIFIRQNFLEGKYIRKIFDFASDGSIYIILPLTTINEVKAQFHLKVAEGLLAYKKYMTSPNAKYLRNVSFGKKVNDYSYSKLSVLELRSEFEEELDELLTTSNVTILPYGPIDSNKILKPYFEEKPPFSSKKDKKYEFPDAFIIEALKEWFKDHSTLTILSGDSDFSHLSEELEGVTVIEDIKHAYNVINNQLKVDKERLEKLDDIYSNSDDQIIQHIKDYFTEGVLDDISYYMQYTSENIYDISNLQFKDFSNHGYNVKTIHNEEEIEVEILIDFEFTIDVMTDDLDSWVYDSEDKEIHYRETATIIFEGKVELAFEAMLYIINKSDFEDQIEFGPMNDSYKITIYDPHSHGLYY